MEMKPDRFCNGRDNCDMCSNSTFSTYTSDSANAQKCPVCNGSGKYTDPNAVGINTGTITCHGCDGKGWIKVA